MTALLACHPLVVSEYGSRVAVKDGMEGSNLFRTQRHDGVDIRARRVGASVLASAPGRVVEIRDSKVAGTTVVIEHFQFARWTLYGHLESTSVRVGKRVGRGEKIGEVGLFPYSSGVVHVHWRLCTKARCYGYGPAGGTEDPIEIVDGCFDSEEHYPTDRLVLTYPVDC